MLKAKRSSENEAANAMPAKLGQIVFDDLNITRLCALRGWALEIGMVDLASRMPPIRAKELQIVDRLTSLSWTPVRARVALSVAGALMAAALGCSLGQLLSPREITASAPVEDQSAALMELPSTTALQTYALDNPPEVIPPSSDGDQTEAVVKSDQQRDAAIVPADSEDGTSSTDETNASPSGEMGKPNGALSSARDESSTAGTGQTGDTST